MGGIYAMAASGRMQYDYKQTNSQNDVYKYYQPFHPVIKHDTRSIIFDALLTVIFKME